MMILRSMPDLSTAEVRQQYHRRAAQEGALVSAWTQQAVYQPHFEQLSVKAAYCGREHYIIDGVRRSVDDDVYLIINQGHEYESLLTSDDPVHSVAVVFSDEMCRSAAQYLRGQIQKLLDSPQTDEGFAIAFEEHLRPHDRLVSPALRYLARMSEKGIDEAEWYEEQAHFLLERMLARRRADGIGIATLPFERRSTRNEVYRRISLATDYMLSCYAQRLTLAGLASIAGLGRHHFLRMFSTVHGVTPFYFLTCKRLAVAARLLEKSRRQVRGIAGVAGFRSQNSLVRSFRQVVKMTPSQYRHRSAEAADEEFAIRADSISDLLNRKIRPKKNLAGRDRRSFAR